ncbi:recombination factor RarA [Candidatus Protochlamydia naegleriophila]|uniref:Replication-associated recombination protein A n=1 Tax=Candidatus Protochlamydia naegleriophila TaxID=389348 RepID=A0A0U5ER29_9BACT|nr:replication-associated recombination protein A [Candidatus Protochlamydia naegleriophila]CUI16561.1 recombination factor RarA [Candidatus Protochlamydia naegleriophila]
MKKLQPLAEELRPKNLEDVVGQDHLLGENGLITKTIQAQTPLSIILWGPPGCGKTSLARLYAKAFNMRFVAMSAIFSGIADLKKTVKEAQDEPLFHKGTLLFVDEIHRFNKAQQDAFLPYVENGTVILIGATAENPSFYLNGALLSRLRVLPLYPLDAFSLERLLERYEKHFAPLPLTPEARHLLIAWAQGDGRYLYNLVENLRHLSNEKLDVPLLEEVLQKRSPLFDKAGDQHYNLISALHKSVRGSDPDAALYWFTRMLEGGEEPLFLARRLIRMAVEDIGLSDPQALQLAIAAKEAYQMLGSPEGELALAEVVVYLALSPKSNSIYQAYNEAKQVASQTGHLNPPAITLNAPTQLMKKLGYGRGYMYDHDQPEAFSGQNYFPSELERQQFYLPVERGFERELKKRLDYFEQLRQKRIKTI